MRGMIAAAATLLLLLAAPPAAAKDPLAPIRARYEWAEAQEKEGGLESVRTEIQTTKPGIGPQRRELRFSFSSEHGEKGATYELVRVSVDYHVAASVQVHLEYLFDPSGKLVFHYRKATGMECGERRYYLEGERLIRLRSTGAGECLDDASRHPTLDKGSAFSKEEQKEAAALVREAAVYRAGFAQFLKLDEL